MSNGSSIVSSVLGLASGGSGVLVLRYVFGRKREGADTAAVLLKAGSDQVVSQAAQISRQDERIARLEQQNNVLVAAGQKHTAWDYQVMRALREAGIAISDPPPLGFEVPLT